MMHPMTIIFLLLTFLGISQAQDAATLPAPTVCIIGSGIGGSSVAHFLRKYSHNSSPPIKLQMLERNGIVGGRMATVTVAGDTFEAGAAILLPNNIHALNYSKLLNLEFNEKDSSSGSLSLGIWDGKKFVFKTVKINSSVPLLDKLVSLVNSLLLFIRYGFSLLKMNNFVESIMARFLKYYDEPASRPIFETPDEMLKWAGLYNLTTRTLQDELVDLGLSPLLIKELVTVSTRIDYGQSVSISGLAGTVALAGSGGGLWSIKGGNWQMAAGLINQSDVALHLHEEIESIADLGDFYELKSTKGNSYTCEIAVVATPLDESNIQLNPKISISKRKTHHAHTTFVRGLLNPAYFGLSAVMEIPELVGTVEDPNLPFCSISILKKYDENDATYKIFSRQPMSDTLLDNIFSVRKETTKIDWPAYPHYHAPEVFTPFLLDGRHLYYVNTIENAASNMEMSAVAAENVARLVLSRYFGTKLVHSSKSSATSYREESHLEL